jgi:hypothetical protein
LLLLLLLLLLSLLKRPSVEERTMPLAARCGLLSARASSAL